MSKMPKSLYDLKTLYSLFTTISITFLTKGGDKMEKLLPDYTEDIKKLHDEISEEIRKIRPRSIRNLLDLLFWSYTDLQYNFEYLSLDKKDKVKYIMKNWEFSRRTAQDYQKAIELIRKIQTLENYISKELRTLIFLKSLKERSDR